VTDGLLQDVVLDVLRGELPEPFERGGEGAVTVLVVPAELITDRSGFLTRNPDLS
jgi:hypothetical protein